jgi:Tol biopolymer transport system component
MRRRPRGRLVVVNSDGSGEQRLTHDGLDASATAWSPEGRERLYGWDGLYVIDADRSALPRLASRRRPISVVAGWKIAYVTAGHRTPQNPEMHAINADRTGLNRLTNNRVRDKAPLWSPDRRRIAFYSERNGTQDVWVMTPS